VGAERAEREPAPPRPTRRMPLVQRKLVVGPADDGFEQEADRVADAVMQALARGRAPEQPDTFASAGATRIQPRRAPDAIGLDGGEVDVATASAIGAASRRGAALDSSVRRQMEHGFGADFSAVRVHTDARADAISDQLQARAFTAGRDIFFSAGAYAPSASSGQHLLAHELAHVVQQGHAPVVHPRTSIQRAVDSETPEVTQTGTGDGRSTITPQESSGTIGSETAGVDEDRHTHLEAPATKLRRSTRIQVATSSASVLAAPPVHQEERRIRRMDVDEQWWEKVGDRIEPSVASGQPNAISSSSRIRRSTFAMARFADATATSRVMQRTVDTIVRRKFANLPAKGLKPDAEQRIGNAAKRSLKGYNATPQWDTLAGKALEEQLDGDGKKLKFIETTLSEEDLYGDGDNEAEDTLRYGLVKEVIDEAGQHTKELVTWRKQAAAAAEAAKPLKEKHLVGLEGADVATYQQLVGDADELADVSDESVAAIVKLYSTPTGVTVNGKAPWQTEFELRERQKRDLGGDEGWMTEALRPHAKVPAAAKALELIGDATKPEQLSQEVMVQIIDELGAAKVPATEVKQYLGRQVDERAAGESAGSVAEKAAELQERGARIRENALGKLGAGKTWAELSKGIDAWWKILKERTAKEKSFEVVYASARMTVRGVAKGGEQQGGKFKAQIMSGESGTTTGQADMTLERDCKSILDRTNPTTWTSEKSDLAAKQKTGLYELSASLLDPKREDIFAQLKFYSTPEAVVFAPAAYPEDQQIFAAISALADADQPTLREISSEMTRIVMAQSTDMGTKLVDMSAGNTGDDIRYGESGTLIRYAGGKGKAARAHEIEARRLNALQYFNILDDSKHLVNEVVVEYRRHASGLFPLFTEIDRDAKRFYILDSSFKQTGEYIDNKGEVHKS
jgi:Domain of unknown function (DUF4157)